MALIISKTQDDARCVIRLGKAGYGMQAAGLSRSVVESAINSLYLHLDPEKHGKAYLQSIDESNRRLAKGFKPHASDDEVAEVSRTVESIANESGWPNSIEQRVQAVGQPMFLYDVVYLQLSQILQGDIAASAGKLKEDEHGNLKTSIGRSNHWVTRAFVTCFLGAFVIAQVAYKAFELDQSRLEECSKKFQELNQSLDMDSV